MKVPELRFWGYSGEWESRELQEMYGKIRNAFVGTATPYYVEKGHFYLESNNVKNGAINRNSEIFINDFFYQKQKDNWLHTDDLVMVQSGHVGHTAVIPESLNNTAAHALIIISVPFFETNPNFIAYQLQSPAKLVAIDKITTGNTIKHILASEIKEFKSDFPSLPEQTKIGTLFQTLDTLLTNAQQKHEKLLSLKKAMLTKMFPQKGQTEPEVRFRGFDGEWEEQILSDIVVESTERTSEFSKYPLYSLTIEKGVTKKTERYERGFLVNKETDLFKIVSPKHFVVNPMNLRFGAVGFNKNSNYVSVSGYYDVFSIDNSLCSDFWLAYLKTNQALRIFDDAATGSLIEKRRVHFSTLKELIFITPKTIEEKQEIGNFFRELDLQISLQADEIQSLKNLKQALLSKMFVS